MFYRFLTSCRDDETYDFRQRERKIVLYAYRLLFVKRPTTSNTKCTEETKKKLIRETHSSIVCRNFDLTFRLANSKFPLFTALFTNTYYGVCNSNARLKNVVKDASCRVYKKSIENKRNFKIPTYGDKEVFAAI